VTETREAAVRFVFPPGCPGAAGEDSLFEALGDVPCSTARGPLDEVSLWVSSADALRASAALRAAGFSSFSVFEEPPRDWVAEAAALRHAVLVDRYLLDPHDGDLATAAPAGVRRLWLPAARAFGTGSHESTRLALRLLLAERLGGARVLDAGCGTGTLAFVASLEGAAHTVAFDLDPDAAVATRGQAAANGIERLSCFAGPLEALKRGPLFDVIVANMIQEEVGPLLPGIRGRLRPGGRLVTSGQLVERRGEWEEMLRKNGFRPVRSLTENEWVGMTAERDEGTGTFFE